MKLKKLLIASVCGLALTGVAHAGSPAPAVNEPVIAAPAPVLSWSGPYAGIFAGAAGGTQDYANPAFNYTLIRDTLFGGFVGYNFRNGDTVYGAEFALSKPTNGLSPTGFPGEDHLYIADLKGRVGRAMGNALVYGFAGVSVTSFDNIIDVPKTLTGPNIGAGVDFKIGDSAFLGVEYMWRKMTGEGNTGLIGQTRTTTAGAVQIRFGIEF